MRSMLATWLVLLGIAGGCNGESTSADDDAGAGGEPNAGGDGGTTSGTGGDVSTGGSGPAGGASTGGSPNGGTSNGGTSNGGTSNGGGPTGGTGAGGAATGGSGGIPAGCVAQRVSGVGDCDAAFGVFFLGGSCGWVSGCSCEGEDCDAGYESEEACAQAHRGCVTGCTPQDAAFLGTCEPLPRKVFTGVECVEMLGCSCAGEDCETTYGTSSDPPEPTATCESAHANCAGMARSCAELRIVYEEYASRDACQEDSDCRLTFGHCGIGIGGCHYFMNKQWPEEGLDSLAAEFQAESCTGAVCDCAEPPASVECVDGRCVAGP